MSRSYNEEYLQLLQAGNDRLTEYGLGNFLRNDRDMVCDSVFRVFPKSKMAAYFGAAADSFLIFRGLHDRIDENYELYTLLGDYFFSLFSDYLIPIDSTEVVIAFSDYLKKDINKRSMSGGFFDVKAYCEFLEKTIQELELNEFSE